MAVLSGFGHAPRAVELGVLVMANLIATVVRFVLLRGWVFHRAGSPRPPGPPDDRRRGAPDGVADDRRGRSGCAPHPPRWTRPGLWALLTGTALLYLWGLGASGWANEYYAAAVQAGSRNWTALLFGSLDPGNAITVDKPPHRCG